MKKLFTLIAFLAFVMGANAVEQTDFTVDYTQVGTSTIGWKADVVADDLITADADGLHLNNPAATENWWDYQLWIFNNATLEVDMSYTVKIVAKVSEGSAKVRCRVGNWDGGIAGEIEVNSTEYNEYIIEGAATTSSNGLLVQFGDYVGTVSFKSVTITHEGKEERPAEWLELLTNGDAETPWGDLADVAFNDQENNFKICAWGKVNQGDPTPAEIVEEGDGHAFIVRATDCVDPDADASAWDNQFWIQAPRMIKAGEQVKVHFRYKASQPAKTNTQIHKQNPSDYKHHQAIGDINFTTDWQEYDQVVTWPDAAADEGWSIAFNLNPEVKTATDFYFDDLQISEMKLDRGLYVASSNTETGIEYDFDNATELVYDEGISAYTATVGTSGKEDTWVTEVMISSVRGNDRQFRVNTIKPTNVNDCLGADAWGDYKEASSAKIQLPAAGVWAVNVDTESMQMNFVQIEGDPWEIKEPLEEIPNTTEVVVKGQEREDLQDSKNNDGVITVNEDPDDPNGVEIGGDGHTGQPWDNQFFIVANRTLSKGEVTIIKFKYKASVEGATSGTQLHGDPGAYKHWDAIGSFNFTTEYQTFEKTLTIPAAADGMKSIAFNMAEIKGACDYYIKDVIWMTADHYETLIDVEGTKNFYVKEGAGTTPYQYGTTPETSISSINAEENGAAVYNLAGQKVSKAQKGLFIKNGKKFIVK